MGASAAGRRWALVLLAALAACVAGPGRERNSSFTPELARRWHYDVRIDAALRQIDVAVCFEGPVPAELRAGKDEAAFRLRYARWLSPGAVRRLPVENGRIQLDASARDACIGYGIELAEGGSMGATVRRVGRDVLASPNTWLWRPQRRAGDASATLRLALPDGLSASLPWPLRGDSHALEADAFRYDSHAAFGRFEPHTWSHRGVQIEAAVLDGEIAIPREGVQRWLSHAIDVAALGGGGFPNPSVQVIVVPSGTADEPVPFGTVARGGGGSVLLFVSSGASEAELRADWVLPHELSHLFLPYVAREHAWLPEGLATYYQEVLRARAGVISEERALENLARSMRSASREGTGRTLAAESREMYTTYAFRPVYWAGAAYFLIADVELRRRSHGHQSLDQVLAALRLQGAAAQTWTDSELLARLDRLAGDALFVPLAQTCLARSFPDFEPTLEALGARGEHDAFRLDDAAALAEVRRALFRAPVRL